MFRYEVGATILVSRFEDVDRVQIEVKILAKAPNTIKALVLSDGWFARNTIHILSGHVWYSCGRMKEQNE